MPRHRRLLGAPVDDEFVALRLARDRLVDGLGEERVIAAHAQRRPQVRRVVLAELHVKRACAGEPHAVAAFAKEGHRGDQAQVPARLLDLDVTRRPTRPIRDVLKRPAVRPIGKRGGNDAISADIVCTTPRRGSTASTHRNGVISRFSYRRTSDVNRHGKVHCHECQDAFLKRSGRLARSLVAGDGTRSARASHSATVPARGPWWSNRMARWSRPRPPATIPRRPLVARL